METIASFFYVLTGFVLRLAVPIAVTVLLIFFLRTLDARWQAEAELKPNPVAKPECWKIKGCAPEQVESCSGAKSSLACWQVYRMPNGYLNEKCLSCQVFVEAPLPSLKAEPRRL